MAAVTNAAYGVAILTDAARTFKARSAAQPLSLHCCSHLASPAPRAVELPRLSRARVPAPTRLLALSHTCSRLSQVMYGEEAPSLPALGAARFDGLALLQSAAVLYAVRDCKDKRCRRALNGAIAVNQFADAAMTQWQRQHGGLDATQAHVSTAVTLGVGAYAAWHLWRDVQREREASKPVLVAPPGGVQPWPR